MSKNQSKRQEPTPAKEENAVFDDFFTQFIEKRKKYFVQKLEEIAQLEKSSELKPDQREKVNNKPHTLEKVKYFDDIKALYFEAAAKKGKTTLSSNTIVAETNENSVSEIVDVLAVGQLLSSSKKVGSSLNSETTHIINEVYGIITGENLAKLNATAKSKLAELLHDKKTVESLSQFLKNELPKETPKMNEHKKTLFHESSDEESKLEKPQTKHPHSHTKHVPEKHTSQNLTLVPLPEKEEVVVEEFVKLEKVYKPSRGKKPFMRGPSDFKKKEHEGNEQGTQQAEENQESNNMQRGGYKGKRFDPNYKKAERQVNGESEKKQEEKAVEEKSEVVKQE